ncbi:MAG: hypothetical protein ACI4ST_05555, partial [Candidatus Gallimonas sp.]
MKIFNHVKTIFCFALVCCLAFCATGCNASGDGKPEKTVIRMALTVSQQERLDDVVAAFNAQSGSYRIEFDAFADRGVKNYYLTHGALDDELIVFDNLYSVNVCADRLYDIRRLDVVVDYQDSIVDYMRAEGGALYALPAPGDLICNLYNESSFAQNNVELPQTINELIIASQRLSQKTVTGFTVSSTAGGDDSVFYALMSVAYPNFLFSPRGHYFIKNYLSGNAGMGDGAYIKDWRNVFDYFSSLYSNRFYSLKSTEKTIAYESQRFASGSTYAMQNTPGVNVSQLLGEGISL